MIYLETPRLILRNYRPEDLPAYFRLNSDSKTMYYLQDIAFTTLQEAEAEFSDLLAQQVHPQRTFYFLHLEERSTGAQVGSIGYTVTQFTPMGKLVHLDYFTYPPFWNRGYVTEALRELLRYAFQENGVYRVTTGCLAENQGSERVMQKCGLIREGVRPDWEWHDGELKTRLEYRLLRHEWSPAPNTPEPFFRTTKRTSKDFSIL